MIIHTHIKKRKAKKPNAKQRQQKASWQALLKKYDVKPGDKLIPVVKIDLPPYRRETPYYPSLNSGLGNTAKKQINTYTGSECIGISIVHKSGLQPIFSEQQAKDVAKMRR
jgi:hypothetical protein